MVMLPNGTILKRLRIEKKLTQAALATQSRVSQSLIARIERGTVDPRLSTLHKIVSVLESSSPLTAGDIMSKPVIYSSPKETISKTISKMNKYNISQLPVMDKLKQVGSVTDSLLIKSLHLSDPSEYEKTIVKKVMAKPFPSVSVDDSITNVYSLLQKHPAVIVIRKGSISGIITKADVLGLIR